MKVAGAGAIRPGPFHGYAHNQIWLEIAALAADLLAWIQTLAWNEHEPARRWEPNAYACGPARIETQPTHTTRPLLNTQTKDRG